MGMITNVEWTSEMKVSLVKIDVHESKKGRGFMQRIKEVWDERSTMVSQWQHNVVVFWVFCCCFFYLGEMSNDTFFIIRVIFIR